MADAPRVLALFGARVLFGQERANIDALVALAEEGCEVLCLIRPESWPELLDLRVALESRGLAWITAPYIDYPVRGWILHTTLRNPAAYFRGNEALRGAVKAFSPTHIHAFNPLHVAAFYSALRALNLPMVFRAGEKPVRHNAFFRALWRFIVRRSSHFVADSEFIKRELISTGVDPARVSVLYAPPPRRAGAPPAEIPNDMQGSGLLRFVYVGQLSQRKGVDLLLEAFRGVALNNANVRLLVAGPISDWAGDDWARSLRNRAQGDPDTGERVCFLGMVENAPDLIRQCDVHVAPSVCEEGYGLVIVEAKSVGRASIIFPSGGMAELVEDGVDGSVVAEKSVTGLERAMFSYAAQRALADEQGRAAKASLARFGFDSFSQRWRRIYDGTIGGMPSPMNRRRTEPPGRRP